LISFLQGRIKKFYEDRITLLVNGIGYDILIPAYLLEELKRTSNQDDTLSLYISFIQTERQPKPVLVGFKNELEKDFFELFISVEDIGPSAAIKAITIPIRDIARYIEDKDIKGLRQLKGIGERKAEKIVATLKGRVARYALLPETEEPARISIDFRKEVEDVLVNQLGHKVQEARKMIADAMERNPNIRSSEELFEEVYRGQRQ